MSSRYLIKFPFFYVFIFVFAAKAQNFHAFNGSKYAGVLGVYNNPASSVNAVSKWDVSLFSVQLTTNNSALILNDNVFKHKDSLNTTVISGNAKRQLNITSGVDLLNFRCKLNRNSAFAFGVRVRTYNHVTSSAFGYEDTLNSTKKFLAYNHEGHQYAFSVTSAAWLETFFNYSQVLVDNPLEKLSGGVTLGILKGISGIQLQAKNLSFQKVNPSINFNEYILKTGDVRAVYSNNYTHLTEDKPALEAARDFFNDTKMSLSLSFGIEYLVKKQDFYEYKYKRSGYRY
jgi:hypothetical protein